jgi:ferric-dicitrate binding protein FerR (iron transport regulator)
MNTQNERLWQLAGLKFSGEATAEELNELDALIKANPQIGFQLDIFEKIWSNKQSTSNSNLEESFNKHLQRLSNHLSEPSLQYEYKAVTRENITPNTTEIPFYKRVWFMGGIAASLLIAFLFLNHIYSKKETHTTLSQNSVSTKLGSKSKIQLPDGTMVWLNADSKLTYNEHFDGKYREVYLSGEAYFDVVKDKERPFIIHARSIDVKVLGTAFNVRSYPNDKTIETALIRGSVEVSLHDDSSKKIILKPNEKLIVHNKAEASGQINIKQNSFEEKIPIITIAPVHNLDADSTTYETSWVKNKLAFDSERLDQVALKIERWFGVKVTITDETLKEVTYTGLYEDESLPEVIASLQLSGRFNYTINRKEIIIRP